MGSHWIAIKWMANHPQEHWQKTPNCPSPLSAIPSPWALAVDPFHGVQLHTPQSSPHSKEDSSTLKKPLQLIQGSRELKFPVYHKETENASSCTSPWSTIRNVCWSFIQKEPCQFLAWKIEKPKFCPWQRPRCLLWVQWRGWNLYNHSPKYSSYFGKAGDEAGLLHRGCWVRSERFKNLPRHKGVI